MNANAAFFMHCCSMENVKRVFKFILFYCRGKAPIASMDAMEDVDLLSGSNTHLSKLSSECNIAGNAAGVTGNVNSAAVANMAAGAASLAPLGPPNAAASPTTKSSFPGLKYRNIGKTGLKVIYAY